MRAGKYGGLLVLSILTVAGCATPRVPHGISPLEAAQITFPLSQAKPQAPPQEACGEPKAGLVLCARVEKAQVDPDEPLKLIVTLRNVSTTDLPFTLGLTRAEAVVKDEGGELVPLVPEGWDRIEFGSEFGATLRPGEKFEENLTVNERRDMTFAGRYSITASRPVSDLKFRTYVELTSGTVTVEVVRAPLSSRDIKDHYQVYLLGKLISDMRSELKRPAGERDNWLMGYAAGVFERATGWRLGLNLDAWEAFLVGKVLVLVERERARPAAQINYSKIAGYWRLLEETTGQKFGEDVRAWKALAAARAIEAMEQQLAMPEGERKPTIIKWCWLLLQRLTGRSVEADVAAWKKVLEELK